MTLNRLSSLRGFCRLFSAVASTAFLLFLCAALFPPSQAVAATQNQARDLRLVGDRSRVRVVLDFQAEPQARWQLLRSPHRLVVDMPQVRLAIDPEDAKARGIVKSVRYGTFDGGASRLVIAMDGPFTIERFEIARNENGEGYRLMADLVAASEAQFSEALAAQAQTTASIAPQPGAAGAKFRVVIDPGHGGVDGGAEGTSGTVEKAVTLSFAKELRDRLSGRGVDVSLTRDDDTFLRLDERVAIARRAGADLFISIHADTIRLPGITGATVYTMSEKASDPEAAALAIRENLSDELSGIKVEERNQEVADILVDLVRRETHGLSTHFARTLISEMTGNVGLINNPHRAAGFRVLKAPDVPSVLVELGYLSNKENEAQLQDPVWRGKAIGAIAAAVSEFSSLGTVAARTEN
ncbi:MAG: N-acetylmuramoyl-L-alanine amidase [Methylobacterium mesophilicum]|nr:N-acetylmuramoyl-L-alanine amidase [Methylobacterium mesophilicum]